MHLAPNRDAPYRYLFLDLNAFFASVEQQENPELRGNPVGVVPMLADSTVLIAASYEAKKFGCNTLTRVGDAKRLCPHIILVEGNHRAYAEYHDRVVKAVESVVPVEKVCSIDEMRVRLLESEATEEAARAIAFRVKNAIFEQVGECMTCSIGLAPNALLSKVASDMEKPNGLVLLHPDTMAERLAALGVTEFCGINLRMAVRLNLGGIFTAADMLSANEAKLRSAFGSVIGARWWYLLRGYDVPEEERPRKSLGNSHVLPPEHRTREGSYQVLLRLLQKATARLRRESLSCRQAVFFVRGAKEKWVHKCKVEATCETLVLVEILQEAWANNPIEDPRRVGLTLFDLDPAVERTPSIFDRDNDRQTLAGAVDALNAKFGKNAILPAGVLAAKDSAEERIAFQKTSLFDEGPAEQQ
ncbi:MAG: DNA polymerase [Armatimonadetes bacterium]|nr:DNA polymerase [Armatimonadota bacterium]